MPPSREHYIDRLRTAMTVIVIVAHTFMTYGAMGSWFYREIGSSRAISSVSFSLFLLTAQAFLMGFFFLLAGYFTPASYDKKGIALFLKDRVLRLAIPLLFFGLVFAPLCVGMVNACYGGSFWPTIVKLWNTRDFINGPMWFAEVLLLLSLGYSLYRLITTHLLKQPMPPRTRIPSPIPGNLKWLLAVLGIGVGSVILRKFYPVSALFYGLWIGYFSSYIFLFVLGVAAYRGDWFAQLNWRQARPWLIVTLVSWPILPGIFVYLKLTHRSVDASGGFNFPSLLYAFWEPFIACGAIATAIVWFRHSFNRPSPLADWLGRRAYAVYFIHPPILVGISLLFRHWHTWSSGPIFLKSSIVAALACIACWLAADPLIRLPGLRKIF